MFICLFVSYLIHYSNMLRLNGVPFFLSKITKTHIASLMRYEKVNLYIRIAFINCLLNFSLLFIFILVSSKYGCNISGTRNTSGCSSCERTTPRSKKKTEGRMRRREASKRNKCERIYWTVKTGKIPDKPPFLNQSNPLSSTEQNYAMLKKDGRRYIGREKKSLYMKVKSARIWWKEIIHLIPDKSPIVHHSNPLSPAEQNHAMLKKRWQEEGREASIGKHLQECNGKKSFT